MGQAVCYGLKKLGHEVIGYDVRDDVAEKLCEKGVVDWVYYSGMDGWGKLAPDLVISCLPYYENVKVAEKCVWLGLRYLNLGGCDSSTEQISKLSENAQKPLFDSMGLSPGFSCIMCCDALKKVKKPIQATISVGGLPQKFDGKLDYGLSWSLDGLLLNYISNCQYLEDGELRENKAISEKLLVDFMVNDVKISLEGANTAGGVTRLIPFMQKNNVKTFKYFTLRYPEHWDKVRTIRDLCGEDALRNTLSSCPTNFDDVIFIDICVSSENETYIRQEIITPFNGFSAMSVSTGLTTAVVADMMCDGRFDHLKMVNYEDVDCEELMNKFNQLRSEPN